MLLYNYSVVVIVLLTIIIIMIINYSCFSPLSVVTGTEFDISGVDLYLLLEEGILTDCENFLIISFGSEYTLSSSSSSSDMDIGGASCF